MENKQEAELIKSCLEAAIKLYREGKLVQLRVWLLEVLEMFPDEMEFWRLLSVAEGNLGNPEAAHKCLSKIIDSGKGTEIDAANFITGCFHLERTWEALDFLRLFFDSFGPEGQIILLKTTVEALRIGAISLDDLPSSMKKLLNNVSVL